MAGNTLTINRVAGYTADFWVRVTVTDGQHPVSQTFHVSTAAAASSQAAGLSSSGATVALAARLSASQADWAGAPLRDYALGQLFAASPLPSSQNESPALFNEQGAGHSCLAGSDGLLDSQTETLLANSWVDPGPDAGLAPFARGAAGPAALGADFDGLSSGLSAEAIVEHFDELSQVTSG